MAHCNLICTPNSFHPSDCSPVRWLDWENDYPLARAYWPQDPPLSRQDWEQNRTEGFRYCAIVEQKTIAALAAVWTYSQTHWEVAAVSTAPAFRRRGYGKAVVSFVTAHILQHGRIATLSTDESNIAMLKTALSVGFYPSHEPCKAKTANTPAEVAPMITEPIHIKEATTEDIPFLKAMIWQAMLASPTFLAHYGAETLQHLEEEYWSRWPEQPDPAFVALDALGQKLGAITVKPNGEDKPVQGWRIGIAVEPHARGRRIGQHLLERAIAFAKEHLARYINLLVDPTNSRAIALYRRVGFVEVDERDQLIEMRINLTQPTQEH